MQSSWNSVFESRTSKSLQESRHLNVILKQLSDLVNSNKSPVLKGSLQKTAFPYLRRYINQESGHFYSQWLTFVNKTVFQNASQLCPLPQLNRRHYKTEHQCNIPFKLCSSDNQFFDPPSNTVLLTIPFKTAS